MFWLTATTVWLSARDYDMFRVEDGKIAEHWDVMEPLAAEDTWQNRNGKF